MRVLLVGLGRIAWKLEQDRFRYHPCTHAGTLRRLMNEVSLDLVGVCDVKKDKIQSFRRWWKHPIENAQTDYRVLFRDTPADLVIISASLEAHHEIALEAMRRGFRALLIEKPIGRNLKEARALHRMAQKTRTRVWVNFERRYHPAYVRVGNFIEQGKLGPLRSISGRVLTGSTPPNAMSGPLLHDAVHWIDLLLWYIGPPQALTVRAFPAQTNVDFEDTTFASFHYPEFDAVLEAGGRRRWFEFTMQLDFAEGRIVSGNEGHFFYRAGASKRYRDFRELQPLKQSIKTGNAWLELYREIAREIGSGGRRITANLDDALHGMELIHDCLKKIKTNAHIRGKR